MMQNEFEALIGQNVSTDDYTIICQVYNFYPGIKDNGGKEQAAWLWRNFGMRIFKDMEHRANVACELESKLFAAKANLDNIIKQINDL